MSTKNETNEFEIIEYECKGMITNENSLTLNDIQLEDIHQKKSDNEEFIINSSLEELIHDKNIDELTNERSTFDLENLGEIITFKSDNIGNITFENNVFNFSLNGNIYKEIEPKIIKGSLKLNEIKDKTADCELEIKENKNAQLNCNINLENTENHEFISFKSLELKNKENNSIILENFENLKLVNKIKNNENENEQNEKEDFEKIDEDKDNENENEQNEKEKEDFEKINEDKDNDKKKKKNKKVAIILISLGIIVILVIIVIFSYLLLKKRKINENLKKENDTKIINEIPPEKC